MKEITDDLKKINELEKYLEENIVIEFDYEEFSSITKEIIIKNKLHHKNFITNKELFLIEKELEKTIEYILEENTEFINKLKELVQSKELIISNFLNLENIEHKLDEITEVGSDENKEEILNELETKKPNEIKRRKSRRSYSVDDKNKRKRRSTRKKFS